MPTPWTDEQRAALLVAYWNEEALRCPTDSETLNQLFNRTADGYFVLLRCPSCKATESIDRRYDPMLPFRQWTDTEKAALVDGFFRKLSLRCPIDDAPLVANPTGTELGTSVYIGCHRCGNHYSHFPE